MIIHSFMSQANVRPRLILNYVFILVPALMAVTRHMLVWIHQMFLLVRGLREKATLSEVKILSVTSITIRRSFWSWQPFLTFYRSLRLVSIRRDELLFLLRPRITIFKGVHFRYWAIGQKGRCRRRTLILLHLDLRIRIMTMLLNILLPVDTHSMFFPCFHQIFLGVESSSFAGLQTFHRIIIGKLGQLFLVDLFLASFDLILFVPGFYFVFDA